MTYPAALSRRQITIIGFLPYLSDNVRLADEHEFIDKFPDCEVGAMPPFGNLYGVEVFVANSLAEDEEIVFNACSHSQLIKMSYSDYEKLVKPVRLDFAFQSKL